MTRRRWKRTIVAEYGVGMDFAEAEARFIAANVERLRGAVAVMKGFGMGGSGGVVAPMAPPPVEPMPVMPTPPPATPIEPPTNTPPTIGRGRGVAARVWDTVKKGLEWIMGWGRRKG